MTVRREKSTQYLTLTGRTICPRRYNSIGSARMQFHPALFLVPEITVGNRKPVFAMVSVDYYFHNLVCTHNRIDKSNSILTFAYFVIKVVYEKN